MKAKTPDNYAGGTFVSDGQIFHEIARAPHVRKDGKTTTLYTLIGKCGDCGEPFEQKVAQGTNISRRCQEHKNPMIRVKKRNLRLSQRAKSVFD